MKTRIVLLLVILISIQALFAQKSEVNIQKSSIEWHGKKIGKQHEGTIMLKSGSFELKDNKITSGNFVMDMNSITNTDIKDEGSNQRLVGHLKSDDFFGVETYPTASFKITNSSGFTSGKATVSGDITIKGKTESISFDVVKTGNEFFAKIELDRSKFDVRYSSNSFFDNLGDKAIDDIFTLKVKLVVA
jgi:polyisoprenoid-binding protein YceI